MATEREMSTTPTLHTGAWSTLPLPLNYQLIHEKVHPCLPQFVKSLPEGIDASCMHHVLVQSIPMPYHSV